MEIRTARRGDIEQVSLLWLTFVEDPEGSDLNIVPSQDNRKRWINFVETLISSSSGSMKIALWDGKIVGYALYSWNVTPLETKQKIGSIYDLFVLKNYRGRGIGSRLLAASIEDLKAHGVKLVRINVLSKNINAIHLYEKFGFREVLKTMYLTTG